MALSPTSRSAYGPPGKFTPGATRTSMGSIGATPRSSGGSPDNFTKELARLQEEQVVFMQRIENEKSRKEKLEDEIAEVKAEVMLLQNKTRNGNIVKDHDRINKKQLGRLEHQLQMSKIKLSVARNENSILKKKIQDLRRDKMLSLQILNDLLKEGSESRKRLKYNQREMQAINEKKHKVKVAIANMKNKMVQDMEQFSSELSNAKQSISNTQTSLLHTIREQANITINSPEKDRLEDDFDRMMAGSEFGDQSAAARDQEEIARLLSEAGFGSVEELVGALEQSEEQMFLLYNETQEKEEEAEKMEAANKHLEHQVETQLSKLQGLESHHDEVKKELEQSIQVLRSQIQRYEQQYGRNLEVLNGVTDQLMSLLRSIAIDEEAVDQQLLSSGVTDRNLEDFLGLIEQRIDDLIQMSKAAQHQSIRKEDFLKAKPVDRHSLFHAPNLPSLQDGADDDDDAMLDESVKLQPISVAVLKNLMQKKMQARMAQQGNGGHRRGGAHRQGMGHHGSMQSSLGISNSSAGLRSRQSSNVSLRSADSQQSLSSQK